MKKIIFISIVASLFATAVVAQDQKGANVLVPDPILIDGSGGQGPGVTNQYPGSTGTITKSGYTYKYKIYKLPGGLEMPNMIKLYNTENKYLESEWKYKDGALKTEREALGREPDSYYFSYCSQTAEQLWAIIAGSFTTQQKTGLKGNFMYVDVRLDPDTGKVADVYFTFKRNGPFVNIPVETFRSIELALKDKLTITATDNGRKFNFIEFLLTQNF